MAKRKEVKINEEQIRDMMTGDIPAVFMEKNHGNNAADSPKEGGKEPKTENQSGIPAVPNKVEDSGISTLKKYRPRSSERKHARKGTACRIIPNICLITTL
ncbi:hypothetical protein NXX77_26730 [Phocaeicola dorei]|nr:hypothetical protein [Phocaeicola dorei]